LAAKIELGKYSPGSWRGRHWGWRESSQERFPLAVGASAPNDVFSGGGTDRGGPPNFEGLWLRASMAFGVSGEDHLASHMDGLWRERGGEANVGHAPMT
jgi:hypothetical protein